MLVACAAASLAACTAARPPTGSGGTDGAGTREGAVVVAVSDGDTVRVRLDDGAEERVRLIGIDTPEAFTDPPECGSGPATQLLERLLPEGTEVWLVADPTQDRVDRYDRLLRYVARRSDGLDVQQAQLRAGWAEVYVYDASYARLPAYDAAEDDARSAPRGVWARC